MAATLDPGIYTIKQESSRRLLDAHQTSDKDFAAVTREAQNNDSQEWLLLKVDGRSNTYTVQQLSSQRFLDAHQTEPLDFGVVTRDFQGNSSQNWVIIEQ